MKHKELLTKVMRDILSDEKCPIKMNNPATLKMCQRIFQISETTPEKAMPIFIDRFLAYLDQQKSLSEIVEKAKQSHPIPEHMIQPQSEQREMPPQKKPKNNQPEERKENTSPQRAIPSAQIPIQPNTQQMLGDLTKQQQEIDRQQFEILEKMRLEKEQAENLERERLEKLRLEKERAEKEAEEIRELKLAQIQEQHRQKIGKKSQEQPIKELPDLARKPDPIVIDSDDDDVQVPIEVQKKTIIKRVSDTPQLRQYESEVQLQKQQSLMKLQQKLLGKTKMADQPQILKKIQQPIQLQQMAQQPSTAQVKSIQPIIQSQVISVPVAIVENGQQKKKEKKNQKQEIAKQGIVNKQQLLRQMVKCKDCYSVVNEKPNDNLILSETDSLCAKCCLKSLNPFAKIVKELGYLEYVHQNRNGFTQICSFEFNPATIENMKECIFEVRCVKYSEIGLSEMTFPHSYLLQINQSNWQEGKPLLEKSCLHKRKDRPYNYNLPELIKRHHPERGCQFSVEYQVSDSKARYDYEGDTYLFGLFIIRTVERVQLIERALKMEMASVQKNTCLDIQIDKSKISLNCCYSTIMMNVPARGLYCQHKNCFDLHNYFEIQAKTSQQYKLSCPICSRNCFQVIVDKFQYSLIRRIRELGLEKYIDSITLDQYVLQINNIQGNLDQTDDYQKIILDSSIRSFSDIEKKGYKLKQFDNDDDSESEQYQQTQMKQTQEILTIDD